MLFHRVGRSGAVPSRSWCHQHNYFLVGDGRVFKRPQVLRLTPRTEAFVSTCSSQLDACLCDTAPDWSFLLQKRKTRNLDMSHIAA
jgi:hypothetical protein